MVKLRRVMDALFWSPCSWYFLKFVRGGKFIEVNLWFRQRLHTFHVGVDTLFCQSEDDLAMRIADNITLGTFVERKIA